MNYAIVATKNFRREFKSLLKRYRSLMDDFDAFKAELLRCPEMGVSLGGGTRKVRMAISDKGKGKRGGARVITVNVVVDVKNTDIHLLYIYDKGDRDTISIEYINALKRENGLL
jgi:hypothetical protein